MNLFRCSRGIKKPVEYELTYDEVKEDITSSEMYYSQCTVLGFEDFAAEEQIIECNRIVYERYKLSDEDRNKGTAFKTWKTYDIDDDFVW